MSRPELGDVRPGDEVIVLTGGGHQMHSPTRRTPARVVTANRVWITIRAEGGGKTWKMRRDTQNGGSGYTFNPRFVTPAQDAWDRRRSQAREFLREQGIDLRTRSPWSGREVELADLLRTAAVGD